MFASNELQDEPTNHSLLDFYIQLITVNFQCTETHSFIQKLKGFSKPELAIVWIEQILKLPITDKETLLGVTQLENLKDLPLAGCIEDFYNKVNQNCSSYSKFNANNTEISLPENFHLMRFKIVTYVALATFVSLSLILILPALYFKESLEGLKIFFDIDPEEALGDLYHNGKSMQEIKADDGVKKEFQGLITVGNAFFKDACLVKSQQESEKIYEIEKMGM